ncbi:MAG: hypothetical protein J3R72DRAFT_6080 [Linnemannia gamsii]|nr:MAG: hypothetical protein J3R72DRAFT_6080 [Linnemannia gamsii]
MHHTTSTSSPFSLQNLQQYPAKPGSRVSAPGQSRHQKSRSIDRIWSPALDLKLSQIAQDNSNKKHQHQHQHKHRHQHQHHFHHDKFMVDMDMDVEMGEVMGDVIGNVSGGGRRYQSNNSNNNRRALYHLPGVYPLDPERTKDLFDIDMMDTDTDTEMPTDTSSSTQRSKRPWPWTSASASAASVTRHSKERLQEDVNGGLLTVQYLRHSKSWTCLSDMNRLALARASSSNESKGEEDQGMSRSRREVEREEKGGEISNSLALGDKTSRLQQQQKQRGKLDESDRKMLAAQSIRQWQNNTNQSTGSTTDSASNYTQSTSTSNFPHKIVTTTIIAIDDISTGRPTYTASTATLSAVDSIFTNKSTTTASRPSPATAITTSEGPTMTTDDISCYRPLRQAQTPNRATTAIVSPVPVTDDISSRPTRRTTVAPRTDDISSRPSPRSAPTTTIDDISCHRPVRSIPKTDDISSRTTRFTPRTDEISSRPVRSAPRVDDISSRSICFIPTTDDISSRPMRPTPMADDISSRLTRSAPQTDDISSRPTRTAPKIDDISSRPTRPASRIDDISCKPTHSDTRTDDISSRPIRPAPSTSFTATATTAATIDDISCYRPTARYAQMRPQFLAFTPIDEFLDTTMTNTITTTSVTYEFATSERPRSSSPHFSISSPASSGGGRYSPYYYAQLSPYSRAGAASPIPERRWSADTTVQMCILQGFLDRHSNGHIMYPKPKPSKCCSLSGCSNSDSDEDGEEDDDSSSSNGSGSESSSSPTSFSDESDREEEDKDEEEIDEDDEEIQNRMLLLSQSPNLNDLDFRRDFFMTERQSTASNRNADSPVFFQGFPLLNMTRID